MANIGTSPDAKRLAGLLADLGHKVQHGGITLDELALFTQRKYPFIENFLSCVGEVKIPDRTEPFDPNEYFRDRTGLCVSIYFREFIIGATRPIGRVSAGRFTIFELKMDLFHVQLCVGLPEGHVFEDASTFCAYLAAMIDRQQGGEKGSLLTDDSANTFYVRGVRNEIFVVDVHWNASYRRWFCGVSRLAEDQWYAGTQVFSATAA